MKNTVDIWNIFVPKYINNDKKESTSWDRKRMNYKPICGLVPTELNILCCIFDSFMANCITFIAAFIFNAEH